ncbi:MBL fold metallo-hydrolase [Dyadobacter flavalbus]|uniref:MBL fold metallo-hydrolase n=1 Tax=Dyadobacter flavalbus TaxID=2579942 RepID=A0A5M8QP86_9BACT|nr:MBL fold metallo-hydrolase [Dyadobacter flavalbus]
MLLDTGLGLSRNNQLLLVKTLQEHCVDPEQITKVILSHLHKDHTGGIGYWPEDGCFTLTFGKANYFIQQRELVFARQLTGIPSIISHC